MGTRIETCSWFDPSTQLRAGKLTTNRKRPNANGKPLILVSLFWYYNERGM
jgi:hypothetical protein